MADFIPSGIRGRIVGNVVAPAESKFDGDQTELRIAVGHGYKKDGVWTDTGTTFVTYIARGDWQAALNEFGRGDRIQVEDAAIETRTYTKRDGGEGLAVNARFGEITLLEKKGEKVESAW